MVAIPTNDYKLFSMVGIYNVQCATFIDDDVLVYYSKLTASQIVHK